MDYQSILDIALWVVIYICMPCYLLTHLLFLLAVFRSGIPDWWVYMLMSIAFIWWPPAIMTLSKEMKEDARQSLIRKVG